MTIKFGGVAISKALPGANEIFDDVMIIIFLLVHLVFQVLFGQKKVENRNFFVSHSIYLKFVIGVILRC